MTAVTAVLFIVIFALAVLNQIGINKKQEFIRRRNEDEREVEQKRVLAVQNALCQQMLVLAENSIAVFESMPAHLQSAERHLDEATTDFNDGAFAPFWDSIERATNSLANFDQNVRFLSVNSGKHAGIAKQYQSTAPRFPVTSQSVTKLATGTDTADRMRALVRNAQRNFQFAMIYEQRKTNQLLVVGFTNLAQALDQMSARIAASIDNLSDTVNEMGASINDSVRAVEARVGEMDSSLGQYDKRDAENEAARVERAERVIEMLDNIQRNRKPWP